MFLIRVYIPIHLISTGGSVTWDAKERGGGSGACGRGGRALRTRGALGNRPCPLRGSALSGWGVKVKGGRKPAWMASLLAPVPEERSQGRRNRRDGTSRGVAVCLCFPAIREISRGCYQGAPFGVPPPSFLVGGGSRNPPFTRRHLRAAMTLARRKSARIRGSQG